MKRETLLKFRGELELMAVVLFWGLNFPIIKIVLEVMHPHVMNIFRLISAGMVLGIVYYRRTRESGTAFWAPLKLDPRAFAVISVIGWFLYQIAFITGLDFTSAGNGAIIMASAPIWTAVIVMMMGLEKLSRLAWFGLVVSIVGTGSVVVFGSAEISLDSELLIGNGIVLAAAILWGAYTAFTGSMVSKHSPLALTVLALLIALPFMAMVAVPFWDEVVWEKVTWLYWVAIFFSGALSTGIAIVFWNNAVRKLGASHTAAFGNLVPLVALIGGIFMLGDAVLPAQLVGGTLIIGGLVIMRYARRQALKLILTGASDTHNDFRS